MAPRPPSSLPAALLLVSLLLTLLAPAAGAQAPGALGTAVRVAAPAPASREAGPSGVVSAVFQVAGAPGATVVTRVLAPPGWRVLGAEDTLRVPAAGVVAAVAAVAVPAAAPAGSYRVYLLAAPAATPDASARDSLLVVVRPRYRLLASLADAPTFVAAGDRYVARFLVGNQGNAPLTAALDVRSGDGLVARTDSASVTLAAGESRVISVTVATPRALRQTVEHHVTLTLHAPLPQGGAAATAAATSAVSVVPVAGDAGAGLHRLPMRLTLAGDGAGAEGPAGAGVGGGSVELSGSGALADGGATRVDFLARRSLDRPSVFRERDEYRLALRAPRGELLAGDQFFALTPLTELGRSAFGVGGRVTAGPWTAGGFVNHTRLAGDDRAERAAFVSRQLGAGQLALNYLAKDGAGAGGDLWTVRGAVTPLPRTTIGAEYGRSVGGDAAAAWSVRLAGALPRLTYALQRIHADRDFSGYYAGVTNDAASASARLWGRLVLRATFADRATDLSRTRGAGAGQRYSLGSVVLGVGPRLALEYQGTAWRTVGDGDEVRTAERSVVARVVQRVGALSLSAAAQTGVAEDRVAARRTPLRRLTLQSSLRLPWGSTLGTYVEHETGGDARSVERREQLTGGLTADVSVGPALQATVSLYATRLSQPSPQHSATLQARLSHALPNGQRITADVRGLLTATAAGGARRRTSVRLSYSLPLAPAIGRSRSEARLTGRVYDVESGRAIPGALVLLGDRATLTDARGRWTLAAAGRDTQYLRLAGAASRPGWVPTREVPMAVTPHTGKTLRLDVGYSRAATLVARVRLFAVAPRAHADSAGLLVDSAGARGVVVELTGGGETVRRVTDGNGSATFTDLRPGRWTLRVAGELPALHVLEHDSLLVELAPAGHADVALRLLPRRRAVHVVAEGEVSATAAAPVASASAASTPVVSTPIASTPIASTPAAGAATRIYTAARRDTSLMLVARRVYGDASRWPVIWLANRLRIPDPGAVPAGERLVIPAAHALTAAERRARDAYLAALARPRSTH